MSCCSTDRPSIRSAASNKTIVDGIVYYDVDDEEGMRSEPCER